MLDLIVPVPLLLSMPELLSPCYCTVPSLLSIHGTCTSHEALMTGSMTSLASLVQPVFFTRDRRSSPHRFRFLWPWRFFLQLAS